MKRISIFFVVILMVGVVIFYALTQKKESGKNTILQTIAATTYPSYYIASQIAGSEFKIVNISANAADAHDFEPTPQDIYTLKTADLALVSGVHLDDWALKVESNSSLDMSKQVKVDGNNPHYWMSFENLKLMSNVITKELSDMNPAKASEFDANNKKFISQIDAIAKEYDGLKECKNKNIFVSHDAFGYISKPLGIKIISVHENEHEHEEPSIAALGDSLKEAKQKNVKVVFYESDETKKVAELAAKELNVQTKLLFTLEAMPDKNKDFIAMLRENLNNLKEAMDCKK
ncbi:MAG: metal ABC transporter substrate-binding protein [Campylobacterales bacterium]|nr:metal ABC transporter substrate-binding protein [Campylobacterales bacterium]